MQDTLEKYLAAVRKAKEQNLSLAKTQEVVQLPEVRDGFVDGNETRRAGYEAFFRPTLVRNAWEELDPDIMQAYESAPARAFADGVYTIGGHKSDGITALLNAKGVVLVTSLASATSARAAVRRLRELTSKPVKHVIVVGDVEVQKPALDVLKEIYQEAEVMTGPGVIEADGRQIRILREKGHSQ